MKIRQAIEMVSTVKRQHNNAQYKEALNMAIRALELHEERTPERVRKMGLDTVEGFCPKCGIRVNNSMNFCDICGQAITWEGVEDDH